jgi:hypothetical protein
MKNNTPQPETAQTGKPVGVALQQPCSGFAVVGRHASLGYTAVTNPDLSRGFRFEEVWIFGEPRTEREMALWRAVAPILTWVPEDMVHRIPNAKNAADPAAQPQPNDEQP